LGNNDFEISAMLRDIYSKKGIEFQLNAKVTKIDGNKVVFEKDGNTEIVEGENILVSVGRRAVTTGFGLENLNVELFKGGIKTDEKMCTNMPKRFCCWRCNRIFTIGAYSKSRSRSGGEQSYGR